MPAGEFEMGITAAERAADRFNTRDSETPERRVWISQPLLAQATMVTRAEWRSVFANDPSAPFNAPCDDCPVDRVDWFDAIAFANARSLAAGMATCHVLAGCEGMPGDEYACDLDIGPVGDCVGVRLPSEAEWEYMARAGTTTTFWGGDDAAALDRGDWYGGSANRVQPVAQKPANPWGLYDVHGNIREWVLDAFDPAFYQRRRDAIGAGVDVDPLHLDPQQARRVIRGCAFFQAESAPARCAASARASQAADRTLDNNGIRLVRRLPLP